MQRIRLECKPPTDRFSDAVRQAQQLPVIKKRKQRNEYFQVDGKAVFVSKMVERLKLAAERDRLFDIVLKNDCRSRVIDSPWEDFGYFLADGCEDEAVSLISKWARHTVDGLIWALSVEFYQANCNDLIRSIVDDVLLSRSANGARRLYGAH